MGQSSACYLWPGPKIMENPAHWNEVERIIHEAVREHGADTRYGISLERRIFLKLSEHGYLKKKYSQRNERRN